ncbi:MAG TPA: hypothetical protein VH601_05430 [Bryobacteraceae bacterium]|jgi:photosystem II stability/assembly factor-like uncharacterized protein
MRIIAPYLSLAILTVLAQCSFPLSAQQPEAENKDVFKNLKFRNLGPAAAGGRVASVVGVPGNPNIYYVGAASGGVWKTANGGITWKAIFEHEKTSSIGAIALAPSNPNFVWAGTGEAKVRNDITDGAGVYFSSDAGESWKFMGLGDAGQISSVIVDPKDPDRVFVGAIGHAWGPNQERGVFRTIDGGKTWKKVLYIDDSTGVADLAMQPGNPMVLYAAMWHVRRYPWTLVDGGESSGVYRTTDGGDTWKKLSEGLPSGPLGRIAIAVAPSNPNHLYALIAADKGLLWQSIDMGNHWTEVSDNHALDVRPFYFSRMVVSPVDENKVYFLSFNLMESEDGGKTAHLADRGVHSDHHTLWIDPRDPNRMIQGNDGGVFLSLDGAKSWRFLDGLPIEQFYQVAVDSESPFTICGGLQDNSAWCGPSNNLGRKGITNADWYTVVGGDGEYAVPAPSDSNIVYADAQSGYIVRLDKKTHLSHFVRPYLGSVEEAAPSKLKYRFNWTSPIAVSRTDANEVYLGGNVVFKSTDGGKNWAPISGDLTRNDKGKQTIAGGPIHHDISGAETYDTILAITIAPSDPKVIWVGTDDGCIQVTRDGGVHWTRVDTQITGAPEWARVYQVGVSPFDAGTAYVAFDAHELDNRHAYVYKTSDYGKSWQNISAGLPDAPVFVLREDPNVRGFLVLGNDSGLFYSHDAGAHWKPVKASFPTVPVCDLQFVKNTRDLVVATHGRGIFVFDNIRPFEQLSTNAANTGFQLLDTSDGILFHRWERDEDQPAPFSSPNAPNGTTVDYILGRKLEPNSEQKASHETPVRIDITDHNGNLVATRYGPSNEGINRFVWDLRYDGTRRLESAIPPEPPEPGEPERARFYMQGPRVLPGDYTISVTVSGQTEKTTTRVAPDPNLRFNAEDARAQTEAALAMRSEMTALNEMVERIERMERQIADFEKSVSTDGELKVKYESLAKQTKDLDKKLKAAKASIYNPGIQHNVEEDDIHALADLHGRVEGIAGELASAYEQPPNALLREEMTELSKEFNEHLAAFNNLLKDVAAYNKAAYAAGAPTLFAGDEVVVKRAPGL